MNGWTIALASVGASYALWILFLAVMNLARARDSGTLGPVAYRYWSVHIVSGRRSLYVDRHCAG